MAQESDAESLTADALPEGLEALELPGHFFDMVGYRTADDVVFLADCLSSRETLEKYQVSFIYDVAAYLRTLEMVKGLSARMFVPAHAPAAEDVSELAQLNIDKVHEIAEKIVGLCAEPRPFEGVLQRVFADYGLRMTFEQHVLVGSPPARAPLSWLRGGGGGGGVRGTPGGPGGRRRRRGAAATGPREQKAAGASAPARVAFGSPYQIRTGDLRLERAAS